MIFFPGSIHLFYLDKLLSFKFRSQKGWSLINSPPPQYLSWGSAPALTAATAETRPAASCAQLTFSADTISECQTPLRLRQRPS